MGDRTVRPPRREPLSVVVDSGRAILVTRRHGGLGDILMTRPIFHAIKQMAPTAVVTYALPRLYHQAVSDVKDIDYLACNTEVDPGSWPWHGDISSACLRHEIGYRSRVFMHRTKVWSSHLGLEDVPVETHFTFSREELESAGTKLRAVCGDKQVMLITPFSADQQKDLTPSLIEAGVLWAREHDMAPVVLHHKVVPGLPDDVPTITHLTIREWMAAFTFARMVLSTDTAGVHMAGFLHVPACGVFSFTSEKVMCQYYPTVASVQLHRDSLGGLACCPCYDPGSCPYLSKERRTLPCIDDIRPSMIVRGLDQAFAAPRMTPRWSEGRSRSYRGYLGPITSSLQRQQSPELRSVLIDLSGTGRIGVLVACTVIAGIIEGMRNVPVYVSFDDDQKEILTSTPFVSRWNCEPYSVRINVSKLLEGNDIFREVRELVGADLEVIGSGIHVDQATSTLSETMVPGSGFVILSGAHLGDGIVIPKAPMHVLLAILRRASSVVSDDPVVTLLAALSGVPFRHTGEIPSYMDGIQRRSLP